MSAPSAPLSAPAVHVPALDGLRGVAAILVVAHHIDLLTGYHRVRGGLLGVDVFFALSGCLITLLLVREHDRFGDIRLPSFYARRALRLLPALVVTLLLVLVLSLWRQEAIGTSRLRSVTSVLAYVANWVVAAEPGSLGWIGHAWSLSIEEQYYLCWPPVLVLLLRRGARPSRILAGLIAVATASAVYRWLGSRAGWGPGLYWHTFSRADAVVLGSAVGLVIARRPAWLSWARHAAVGLVGAALLLAVVAHLSRDTARLTGGAISAVAIVSALLVAHIAQPDAVGPVRALLESPPLRLAGRTSYGLYLYHLPVVFAVHRSSWHGGSRLREIVLDVVLTVALTTASFVLVERPALRHKRRFERVEVVPSVAGAPAT